MSEIVQPNVAEPHPVDDPGEPGRHRCGDHRLAVAAFDHKSLSNHAAPRSLGVT
jgi:hypothetical protein